MVVFVQIIVEIPKLLDAVADVPVVRVVQVAVSHGLAVQQTIEILLLILNTVIDVPVVQVVQVPSYMAFTCSEFACGVQDYGRFWKITSGWIPYSAPVGSTLDTCLRQIPEVVHFFPVVMQRLVPWSRLFGPS